MNVSYNNLAHEAKEKKLVEEFLLYRQIPFLDLRSVSEFRGLDSGSAPAGPDVKVKCELNGKEVRIGIELTDFQCDLENGQSLARQRKGAWDHIKQIVQVDYLPTCSGVSSFAIHITPHNNNPPKKTDARDFVQQLVRFSQERYDAIQERKTFYASGITTPAGDFEQFLLLKRHMSTLIVHRVPEGCGSLQVGDFAEIGINPDVLIVQIREKAQKRADYDLADVDECWLLICATGETSSNRAAHDPEFEHALKSPEVHRVAKESRFDRVVFWERVCDWDRPLFVSSYTAPL